MKKVVKKLFNLLKRLIKKIIKWNKKEITCKYYVWYFYFSIVVLLLIYIKVNNPDSRYIYGVGDENRISNKCYSKEDGLYCIDEVHVNWYIKSN